MISVEDHILLMPHGACWLWNWRLISLHAPADLLTFLAYASITLIAAYIYRTGKLHKLSAAYPDLWISGAGFVFFCGLSHLGNFLEIWFGGSLYWWTGINKNFMAATSLWFALQFWKRRDDISLVGRVLFEADRQERKDLE